MPQSARDRSQLPPEDGRRIAVHFSEETTDIPRRFDPFVEMEPKVAIPPVQGPLLPGFREVKPGDWGPSPFRTDVLSPRRVALKNCEMAIGCIALDPELVCQVVRDPVPTPLLDASDVATRKPRTVWHGHEHAVHGCHQLRAKAAHAYRPSASKSARPPNLTPSRSGSSCSPRIDRSPHARPTSHHPGVGRVVRPPRHPAWPGSHLQAGPDRPGAGHQPSHGRHRVAHPGALAGLVVSWSRPGSTIGGRLHPARTGAPFCLRVPTRAQWAREDVVQGPETTAALTI